MKRLLIALIAVVVSVGTANATGLNLGNSADANATAAAAAAASAKATGIGVGVGMGGHGGSARSSARGGDASTSVAVDASSRDRLQAPGLGAYAAASGPCIGVSTSGGISFPGFGAMAGRTEIEDECQLREAARLFNAIGEVATAKAILLNLPSVRRALNPETQTASQPTPVQVASAPATRPACPVVMPTREERVFYGC